MVSCCFCLCFCTCWVVGPRRINVFYILKRRSSSKLVPYVVQIRWGTKCVVTLTRRVMLERTWRDNSFFFNATLEIHITSLAMDMILICWSKSKLCYLVSHIHLYGSCWIIYLVRHLSNLYLWTIHIEQEGRLFWFPRLFMIASSNFKVGMEHNCLTFKFMYIIWIYI